MMLVRTTMAAVGLVLAAFLLVALAPSGAAAHGGVPHVHAAQHVSDDSGSGIIPAAPPELRAQIPGLLDVRTDVACDRGCCASGHCSACGTVMAQASWVAVRQPGAILLGNPDSAPPPGLAFEGPPRPPKFLA